jgi:mannose-6-phosphate isomerase-like protein (cupin superfamily)
MKTALFFFLILFLSCESNLKNTENLFTSTSIQKLQPQNHSISPIDIPVLDNVERHIYDYTESDELGLIKMHAPATWTEPIVELQFKTTGIVLNGTLGLEFNEGIDSIVTGNGFVIPKQTRVRIFNAGEDELILIETLQPAYKKELTKVFTDFEN